MHTTVRIPGMHCGGCSALINDVSSDVPAVKSVAIDMATKSVTIEHDDTFDLTRWTKDIESLDPKFTVHPAA